MRQAVSPLQKLPAEQREYGVFSHAVCIRYESKAGRFSLRVQQGELANLPVLFKLFGSPVHPFLSFGKQSVDDTGEVARHRLDGFGCPQPHAQIPEARAQVTVAAKQSTGRKPQNACHPVPVLVAGVPNHLSAAHIPFRAQPQPRSEVLLGWPMFPQFRPEFRHHGLNRHHTQAFPHGTHPPP